MLLTSSFSHAEKDILLGHWKHNNPSVNGQIIEIKKEDELYKIYSASSDDVITAMGELVAIFTYQKQTKKYVGMHKWGGRKKGPISWGLPDGLDLTIINQNEISIVFNDSKYKGGWTYSRIK